MELFYFRKNNNKKKQSILESHTKSTAQLYESVTAQSHRVHTERLEIDLLKNNKSVAQARAEICSSASHGELLLWQLELPYLRRFSFHRNHMSFREEATFPGLQEVGNNVVQQPTHALKLIFCYVTDTIGICVPGQSIDRWAKYNSEIVTEK